MHTLRRVNNLLDVFATVFSPRNTAADAFEIELICDLSSMFRFQQRRFLRSAAA
jgi:hypothetical protein